MEWNFVTPSWLRALVVAGESRRVVGRGGLDPPYASYRAALAVSSSSIRLKIGK